MSDLSPSDVRSVIKACNFYSDVFASVAFRDMISMNKLVHDELMKHQGVSFYLNSLEKKEPIGAYREEGKKVNGKEILPSMAYNGKEVTGLKNIIESMENAIKDLKNSVDN